MFSIGHSAADIACANAKDKSSTKEIQDFILFFIPNKTFKEKLKKIQTNQQFTNVKFISNE